MSLDVKEVPRPSSSRIARLLAREAVRFTQGSEYFAPVYVTSLSEGEAMLRRHEVDAMLVVPPDFSARFAEGRAKMQVILNGTEATTAMSAQGYFEAGVLTWAAGEGAKRGLSPGRHRHRVAHLVQRCEYEHVVLCAGHSHARADDQRRLPDVGRHGARMGARAPFESLFVTPMKILELILSKTIPYFVIAMLGMVLCLVVGRVLYDLPMRGSLVLILGESMLYLVVALGIGLVISGLTKNQFLACHVSLMISFLPSVVLTGFLFDLHAEPMAIRVVSSLIPTTYYLELMKSLFLSGNYWPLIVRDTAVLLAFALFFLGWAFRITRKKVEP